jgi:hypothetical protein
MFDAESGDGRAGRVRIVSESNDRIKVIGSGIAAPLTF